MSVFDALLPTHAAVFGPNAGMSLESRRRLGLSDGPSANRKRRRASTLAWAERELQKMRDEETDPELRAIWDRASRIAAQRRAES